MSPGAEAESGVTRRDAILNGAKLVAGAGIGAQIMAATGADTAIAKQVRSVASAGRRTSPATARSSRPVRSQLPAGFQVFEFGKAGTPMSDGIKTPKHHDGSTLFDAGNDRLTLIRNQENAGSGKSLGKHNAYDRHAKGGVTTSLFDTAERDADRQRAGPQRHRQQLQRRPDAVGHLADLRGVDGRHAQGLREGARLRLRDPEGRDRPDRAEADQGDGPVRARGLRDRPEDGHRLHDRGQGGRTASTATSPTTAASSTAAASCRCSPSRAARATTRSPARRSARSCRCEWVTINDPDPEDAERHAARVYQQGRDQGAARFMGLEGANVGPGQRLVHGQRGRRPLRGQVWRYTPPRNLKHGTLELVYESNEPLGARRARRDRASARAAASSSARTATARTDGGTNYLRVLTPNGKMETFAKNTTPLDLVTDEDDGEKKGKFGRSEWSGACYSPDGKWLFVAHPDPRHHLRDHRSLGEGLDVGRRIVVASPGSVELGEEALDPATIVAGSPRTFEGEIATAPLADGVDAGDRHLALHARNGHRRRGRRDLRRPLRPGDDRTRRRIARGRPRRRLRPARRSRDELDRPRDPDEGLRDRRRYGIAPQRWHDGG